MHHPLKNIFHLEKPKKKILQRAWSQVWEPPPNPGGLESAAKPTPSIDPQQIQKKKLVLETISMKQGRVHCLFKVTDEITKDLNMVEVDP